ncbi:hypothetical protein [Streptomyces vilmorinianum]|uniref:hypothetical protein n=1 Tax=Streptomyces vilmorinianum TaxID=3051092 RepID=UPI0010FBB6F0|nr:hypothetical protein [Streptomyces vilmorinianum]
MTTHSPWRGFGVILLRLVDVAARYLLTYATAWLAIGLTAPPEPRAWHVSDELQSRTEVVREHLETGLQLAWWIAAPSVLIIWVFALAGERTGMAFRGRLAGLLLLPLWFLMFGVAGEMYELLFLGQAGFALLLMRVPLIREHAPR